MRIGSKVIVTDYDTRRISKIKRETKTLWIIDDGSKYKKDTLFAYGSSKGRISMPIDRGEINEILIEVERRKNKMKLEAKHDRLWRDFAFHMKSDWGSLTISQLERIKEIIDE